MKKLIYCFLIVGLILGLIVSGCAPAGPAEGEWPKEVRLLSASVGTSNYGTDAYLAGVLSKGLGIPVGAFPGDATSNIQLVHEGQGEQASGAGTTLMLDAWNGEDPYEEKLGNIRFAYSRGGYATACCVRADSDIYTLEDLKGLRIRVPKNEIMIQAYKSWGINPVPMAWTEVFNALQQKVVDGQDNPYATLPQEKFYEV